MAPQPPKPHWHSTLFQIGFVGPDAQGTMQACWFDTQVLAQPDPRGGFELTVHRHDGRSVTLPGGPILPSDLDPLQIREEIWNQVRRVIPAARHDDLAAALRPNVAVATKRALTALKHGTYHRCIDAHTLRKYGPHYRYETTISAERTAAEVAASQSTKPEVVSRLATEHPDPQIRALAVANHLCPGPTLLACASRDETRPVRKALLQKPNPNSCLIKALTTNTLTQGPLDLHLALNLLLHPLCPARFQDALMHHIHRAQPQFRLQAAHQANMAPPDRRDYLHAELLSRPIRQPHTDQILQAILGHQSPRNTKRLHWMIHHPDRRVRRLADKHVLGKERFPATLAPDVRRRQPPQPLDTQR